MSDERTISRDDYLRLVGLFKLFDDAYKQASAIEHSVAALVGEDPSPTGSYNWTSDELWGVTDRSPDHLLERLGIKVER